MLGDVAGLAASIEALGLLNPISIRPDGSLVHGERRLNAFKHLGRKEIPATVLTTLEEEVKFLEAQRDENTCRLELTGVEAKWEQGRLIPKLEALAKAAQKAGGKEGGKIAGKGRKRNRVTGTSGKANRHARETAARAAAPTHSPGRRCMTPPLAGWWDTEENT